MYVDYNELSNARQRADRVWREEIRRTLSRPLLPREIPQKATPEQIAQFKNFRAESFAADAEFLGDLNIQISRATDKNAIRYAAIEAILDYIGNMNIILSDEPAQRAAIEANAYRSIEKILIQDPLIADPEHGLCAATDEKGVTLFMKAVDKECETIAELFIRYGSNINQAAASDGHRTRYKINLNGTVVPARIGGRWISITNINAQSPTESAPFLALTSVFPVKFLAKLLNAHNIRKLAEFTESQHRAFPNVERRLLNVLQTHAITLPRQMLTDFGRMIALTNLKSALSLMPYYKRLREYYRESEGFGPELVPSKRKDAAGKRTPSNVKTTIMITGIRNRILSFIRPDIRVFEEKVRRDLTKYCATQQGIVHVIDQIAAVNQGDIKPQIPLMFGGSYFGSYVADMYAQLSAPPVAEPEQAPAELEGAAAEFVPSDVEDDTRQDDYASVAASFRRISLS